MGAVLGIVGAVGWFTALSVYDLRERRLPNILTLPGAAAVLIAAAVADRGGAALMGTLALFGLYLVVHLSAPTAMGAGDVKLAIGVGALTGAFGVDVWVLAALAAPVLTALWAIVSLSLQVKTSVPHGLSMCIASALAIAPTIA